MIKNTPVKIASVADAIKEGIAMVSEDRKGEGLVLCRSVRENMSLANLEAYTHLRFINKKLEKKAAMEMVQTMHIKLAGLDHDARPSQRR